MTNRIMRNFFIQKIERIQWNAVLTITGVIKGTSSYKFYTELGFESLKFRRWVRKLYIYIYIYFFFELKTSSLPEYLFYFIPQTDHLYNTRLLEVVTIFYSRTDPFKYSFFFESIIFEWNKLDRKIRQSSTMLTLRNYLLKIGRPAYDINTPVYDIRNPNGLKLLTRFRLGLSHLNEHKFNHTFKNCVNPLCSRSLNVKFRGSILQ